MVAPSTTIIQTFAFVQLADSARLTILVVAGAWPAHQSSQRRQFCIVFRYYKEKGDPVLTQGRHNGLPVSLAIMT